MLFSADPNVPNIHGFIHPSVLNLKVDAAQMVSFVQRLPATETAFVCAKLNLLFSDLMRKGLSHIDQYTLLEWLFREGWVTVKDRDILLAHMEKNPAEFLFARQSLLEMIRWLALWGNQISKFAYNDSKRQGAFIRSLLLSADFSTRTQKTFLLDGRYDAADDKARHLLTLPVFRECSLFQVPPYDPLFCLGRFKELFVDCFLASYPAYIPVLEEELGMTIDEYIACLVGHGSLITSWSGRGIGSDLRKDFEFNRFDAGEAARMQNQLKRFVELEGQSIQDLATSFKMKNADSDVQIDLKVLREKPILLGPAGRATFIDETFLMEKAYAGLLFRLAKNLGDKPLQDFGDAFEEYSRKNLDGYVKSLQVNSVNSKGYGPVYATEGGVKREFTDYVFIEGSVVILVEVKAVWTPDAIISSEDYRGELMKRYGVSRAAGGKEKKKGVAQLAEAIKQWMEGKLIVESAAGLPESISRVIPVLLVHDAHLSTLSHGRFLADEFAKLLFDQNPPSSTSSMPFNGISVLNLCVITIDEFEYFEGKVLSKPFSSLLMDYANKYPDRTISAGRYLANLDAEPNIPEAPMVTARNAVIDAASMKLFGRIPERRTATR